MKIPHYISLIAILLVGIAGFYFYRYDKVFQTGVAIALSFSYIAWGIVHHFIHKDITVAVILEYVAVSFLGLVIVLSLVLK